MQLRYVPTALAAIIASVAVILNVTTRTDVTNVENDVAVIQQSPCTKAPASDRCAEVRRQVLMNEPLTNSCIPAQRIFTRDALRRFTVCDTDSPIGGQPVDGQPSRFADPGDPGNAAPPGADGGQPGGGSDPANVDDGTGSPAGDGDQGGGGQPDPAPTAPSPDPQQPGDGLLDPILDPVTSNLEETAQGAIAPVCSVTPLGVRVCTP